MNFINAYKMTYYQLSNCYLNLLTTFKGRQDYETIHGTLWNILLSTVEMGGDPWEQARIQDIDTPRTPEMLEDVQEREWQDWTDEEKEEMGAALERLQRELMWSKPLEAAVTVFDGMMASEDNRLYETEEEQQKAEQEGELPDLTMFLEGLQVAESD